MNPWSLMGPAIRWAQVRIVRWWNRARYPDRIRRAQLTSRTAVQSAQAGERRLLDDPLSEAELAVFRAVACAVAQSTRFRQGLTPLCVDGADVTRQFPERSVGDVDGMLQALRSRGLLDLKRGIIVDPSNLNGLTVFVTAAGLAFMRATGLLPDRP